MLGPRTREAGRCLEIPLVSLGLWMAETSGGVGTEDTGGWAVAGPQRRLLTCWSQSPVSSARSGHGLGHGALFVNTVLNICHLLGISAYGLVSLVPSFVIFLFPDFFALCHYPISGWYPEVV